MEFWALPRDWERKREYKNPSLLHLFYTFVAEGKKDCVFAVCVMDVYPENGTQQLWSVD